MKTGVVCPKCNSDVILRIHKIAWSFSFNYRCRCSKLTQMIGKNDRLYNATKNKNFSYAFFDDVKERLSWVYTNR